MKKNNSKKKSSVQEIKTISGKRRLNKKQRKAVKYKEKDILVLAGAGAGKTLTIIARAVYLIRNGVDAKRILLLTFTRRAAKEMVDRLTLNIGDNAKKVTAGTFHHFCLRTMRQMPKRFGLKGFTVIDRDDQIDLIKLVRGDYLKKKSKLPRAAELANLYSYARNTNTGILKYLKKFSEYDKATSKHIRNVIKAYEKRKRNNHYLDFDDLLQRFGKRLKKDKTLRKRISRLYDHILVDEMQDTNPLQWSILEELRNPAKLYCVGDDAQSIYAFRGADFENVHSFKDRIPASAILRLKYNYRSTQRILDLANWLLEQSPIDYDKRLKAVRGVGIKPKLIDFNSDFDEAEWITQDLWKRYESGSPWKDHMILTRTAWASRTLEAFLIERDIPYKFIGGFSLLQAAHVKDLFILIRSAASHHDELAWIRYLTLWPKIGDVTAAKLISIMKEKNTIKKALKEIAVNLTREQQKIVAGPKTVIKYWDKPAKAIRASARLLTPLLSQRYDKWKQRQKDFQLLVKLAKRYRSLNKFIDTFTLDPITTASAKRMEDEDVVTLITVHSAKGTEAPVCYLIRVEPGMYPYVRSIGDEDAEEEERRILYVAMTRAKDELLITRSCNENTNTLRPGGSRPPYFLADLPSNLVKQKY